MIIEQKPAKTTGYIYLFKMHDIWHGTIYGDIEREIEDNHMIDKRTEMFQKSNQHTFIKEYMLLSIKIWNKYVR